MSKERNIDYLLYRLQQRKEDVLVNISPEKVKDYLKTDDGCRRHMGNLDGENEFTCSNCHLVGRLSDLRKGVPDKLKIVTGEYEGKTFSIHETKSIQYGVKWDTKAKERHDIIDRIEGASSCGIVGNTRANKYLSSDLWLNGCLINWCIEKVFFANNIPHINPLLNSFVCDNNGYKLDFDGITPLIDKSSISEIDAYSILQQLMSIFTMLKPYQFIHGSCTIDKIGFIDKPCAYYLGDTVITGPLTIFISGFDRSSINVGDIRLIPSTEGTGVNLGYSVDHFTPIIKKHLLSKVDLETGVVDHGPLIYSVDGTSPVLLTTIRYSGYPIFGGSFDLYTIITSLLSLPQFRCAVRNSEYLTAIVKNMFVNRVPGLNEDNIMCSIKIAKSLSGIWLYCDAVEKLGELLVRFKPPSLNE